MTEQKEWLDLEIDRAAKQGMSFDFYMTQKQRRGRKLLKWIARLQLFSAFITFAASLFALIDGFPPQVALWIAFIGSIVTSVTILLPKDERSSEQKEIESTLDDMSRN